MTIDLAKLRAETLALIDGTTPGPWEKVTQAGDWGLAGAHFIQPPNCPALCDIQSAIAVIEFETPYPTGSSRKERDSVGQAEANARLIAAAPTLATDNLRLMDDNLRLLDEIERLRADREGRPALTPEELAEFRRAHPLDGLARVALAAWVNVRPDCLPEAMQAHNCPATMEAWARVADAIIAALAEGDPA